MLLQIGSPVGGRRQRFQHCDETWSRTIGANLLQDVVAIEQGDAAQLVGRLADHWRIGIRHDPDLVPGRNHVAPLVIRNGIGAFALDLHRPFRIGQTGCCLPDRHEVEINDDPASQRRQDVAGRDQHPVTRKFTGRKVIEYYRTVSDTNEVNETPIRRRTKAGVRLGSSKELSRCNGMLSVESFLGNVFPAIALPCCSVRV